MTDLEESKGSTPEQRAEIRARLDAALPGPWFGFCDDDGQGTEILIASKLQAGQDAFNSAICDVCAVDGANEDAGLVLGWGNAINQANAELIAHAPADLAALLEDVRVRDERIAAVEKAVNGPHPANSGLDSFTLAYISGVLSGGDPDAQ